MSFGEDEMGETLLFDLFGDEERNLLVYKNGNEIEPLNQPKTLSADSCLETFRCDLGLDFGAQAFFFLLQLRCKGLAKILM